MIYRMTVAGLGGQASMTRMRGGTRQELAVNLIAPPDQPARARLVTPDGSVLPGVTLERINPAVIAELGLAQSASAVVVADPGDTGTRAGLRRGDILLGINRAEVTHPATAVDLLVNAKRRLVLDVLRGNRRIALRFRL